MQFCASWRKGSGVLKGSIRGRLANVSGVLESGKAGQAMGFRKFWGVNMLGDRQKRIFRSG